MNVKKYLENHISGWLPKEQSIAYVHEASKPRWRKPRWIAFTLVVVFSLAAVIFVGVRTYMRYNDPLADVTANYYEKTVNSTSVDVGDVVEVKVLVGWHGYVIPEFKRNVKIVDPFPESFITLASGSNVYEYSGYGGSYQFTYLLRVIGTEGASSELPEPRLYLDNVEIPLNGTSPTLNIASK
jgi:hypothetical protein